MAQTIHVGQFKYKSLGFVDNKKHLLYHQTYLLRFHKCDTQYRMYRPIAISITFLEMFY